MSASLHGAFFLSLALFSSFSNSFVSAACTHEYGQATYGDIYQKFQGLEASGGSTYAKGARANGLHIYIDPTEIEIEETAKVSVHEYVHLLQQGYLNEELVLDSAPTGGVPLSDSSSSVGNGSRFQAINYCGVAEATVTKHLEVLNAMPDDVKLFDHPTFVIFYSQTPGERTGNCNAAQTETFARDAFNAIYGEDCPGMESTPMIWEANENHVVAEGEAEFLATNVYTSSYTSFNGKAYWEQKIADGKTDCKLPGNNPNFYVHSGSSQDVDDMKDKMQNAGVSPACSNNAIGELMYASFVNYCLEKKGASALDDWCTPEALRRVWKAAPTQGFDCAFFNQYDWTWGEVVAKMYAEYQVDTSAVATTVPSLCLYDQTCSGEPKPCRRLPSYTHDEALAKCPFEVIASCGDISLSSASSSSSSRSSPTNAAMISAAVAASVSFFFAFFLN